MVVRSYEDEVQVRMGRPVRVGREAVSALAGAVPPQSVAASQAVVPEPQPTAFLWRGRLYVVREVLAHWYERRAWWTEGAAKAVHGEGDAPGAQVVPSADREVWRVEAGAGRQAGTGIYDLRHDTTADQGWSLLRVTD